MEKGGYKIIDLKDINLTTTSQTLAGLYANIGDNNRKVLLLSGLTINGAEFSDTFATCRKVGTQYYVSTYDTVADGALTKYNIVIDSDDSVVLQVKEVNGINATGQDSGKMLAANGSGGTTWRYPAADNFSSGTSTLGTVLTSDGSGGSNWAALNNHASFSLSGTTLTITEV